MLMILVATLLAAAHANSKVLEITGRGFDSDVAQKTDDLHLVKFFAPWCQHCQKLAPVIEELALDFAGLQDFHVARLDCTDKEVPAAAAAAGAVSNKKFCDDWGIDGFPALYFVQGTLRWEYRGERTREAIEEAVQRMRQPPLAKLDEPRELDALLTPGQVLFLLARPAEKPLPTMFEAVARYRLPNATRFATTESEAVWRAALGDGAAGADPPFVAKLQRGERCATPAPLRSLLDLALEICPLLLPPRHAKASRGRPVLCYATLSLRYRYAIATLCCAVLCCAVLCYAMLCHAMPGPCCCAATRWRG